MDYNLYNHSSVRCKTGDGETTIGERITGASDLKAVSYTLRVVGKSFRIVLGQLCNFSGEKLQCCLSPCT